jgi:hypothetical protein
MAKANGSLSHFQKRHYEAIATAMQHAHVPQGVICDPAKRNQWESVRNELADMFARRGTRTIACDRRRWSAIETLIILVECRHQSSDGALTRMVIDRFWA